MAKEPKKEAVIDEKVEEITPKEKKEIKVIERIIENREVAPIDAFGKMNRPQIELLKKTIAKGASDDELKLFIQVCKGAQLNPFLRQVHLVPRWDNKTGTTTRTIQVSIDGFRSIAESSGAYAGNEDPIFAGEKEIKLEKKNLTVPTAATVTVYKLILGEKCKFTATARWEEYYPGEKLGFQWHIRPFLMLGKCAEALALRKAFPKLLSGMYAQEEMDRTVQVDEPAQKAGEGMKKLVSLIQNCTVEELNDYRTKIAKSSKYTAKQKAEYLAEVDARIATMTVKK